MKIVFCNRCKKRIGVDKAILLRLGNPNVLGWNVNYVRFSLCEDCRAKLLNWLNNK